jgi:hypothetical protein
MRNTSLANLDAGVTMHSFFLRDSLLYKVVNKFDRMFKAGILITITPFLLLIF